MISPLLKSIFGHSAFRPGQEELIGAIRSGRDLLGVMATGSGKSLCYQYPGVEAQRRCLVVSPLISLMNDQVQKLTLSGVSAAVLHSQVGARGREEALGQWRRGELRFLYVAPERFSDNAFMAALEGAIPDYIVIDEAHCIAQWGHDFRPDYQALGQIKERWAVPMAAFTATATPLVQKEIVANLRLREPLVRVHGFYRPNLALEAVMEPSEKRRSQKIIAEATALANVPAGGAMIVYCSSRQRVEDLTAELQEAKLPAFGYHAGYDTAAREEAHGHFRDDALVILVATNAFGMGVDRPDVRVVIHAQMPGTVEAYYQEAGRAGRDSLNARCLLFHSPADVAIHEFFNRQSVGSVTAGKQAGWERHRQDQLDLMRRYAYSASCRQRAIMDYFGDVETLPSGCGHCDNCNAPEANSVDEAMQETVRILLSGAARLQGRFGSAQLVDLVTGSDTSGIRERGHDKLPTFGRLSALSKRQVQILVQALIRQGYLHQSGLRFPVLAVSENGRRVMLNHEKAKLPPLRLEPADSKTDKKRRPKNVGTAVGQASSDLSLAASLRHWRLQRSRELSVPPYTLFWDRTLDELCDKKPKTEQALLAIWGIGEQKRRLFGAELLKIIGNDRG